MSMFIGTGKRMGERPTFDQRRSSQAPVADHEYWGNICSGFGAPAECERIDSETGIRCGRGPEEHRPPKHRAEVDFVERP